MWVKDRTKVIVNGFLVILSSAFATEVSAYTECSGVVLTKVYTDVDGNFFIGTGGYLNGMIEWTASSYKTAVAIATAARVSGAPVIVRYERDGVTCGAAVWSERIIGIGL